jgi:Nucleotide-diphospho-sugar transferase
MKSTFCLAEDRELCEPALKLLLLSLNMHCPGMTINLFYPPAKDSFLAWIKKYPQIHLKTAPIANAYGWNVKPQAIMHMLDQGYDEVIWIDSDVIVNRNISSVMLGLKSDVLVATEDALGDERDDRNALRARLWGFPVGRVLPFGLNTGVLRVSRNHYHLMERWWKLLHSNTYQDYQKRPWRERPVHMLGDQDVLTALLTSKEFSQIPIHVLQRGNHILQFNGVYGYTVAERIGNLLADRPVFIHSFGGKPWSERWRLKPSVNLTEYIKRVYLDLSPYTLCAIRFRRKLECDTEWMEPHYVLSRFLRVLGMGHPALVGLPLAVFADLARAIKFIVQSLRSILSPLESGELEVANRR